MEELDQPPSATEVTKAINQMNSDRASGKDGIPAEIYKAAGPGATEVFYDIIQRIWEQEKMPDDFRDALIVALYKNKGSKADCWNYGGISLLSTAGTDSSWCQKPTCSVSSIVRVGCGAGWKSTSVCGLRELAEHDL